MITQRYDFIGRLDGRTVLGDGSVRYTARLTRTGVFDYGDHKELRLPEEVFKPASVESFKGLSVTDGHKAHIDPENWKTHTVGHVGDDVKQDGRFLVASIVVKDKATIQKIDRKELVELSMGYTVNLDERSGEYDGEKFDAIQRDIVGNHAALGPANWGRAGSHVRLLDGAGEPVADATYAPVDMTTPVLRIDAPSSSDDSIRKDLDSARADAEAVRKERDTARSERDAANKRADTAEAERDAAKKDAEKAKADADAAKKDAEKALADAEAKADEKIEARATLLDAARGVLGADFKATKKVSTTDGEKTVAMSDKDVRVAVLAKVDPSLKLDGKSDDYIAARFEIACESVKTDRAALGNVNTTVTNATTAASGTKSKLDEAIEKANAERKTAAEAGPPAGALVRRK